MTNTTTATNTNTTVEATVEKPVFRLNTSRAQALELFLSFLPQREELGNTAFRKAVVEGLMEAQNTTLASSAATYNIVKKYAISEGLCEDFGRTPAAPKAPKASKPKQAAKVETVNVARAKDGELVAEGVTVAEAEELIAKATKQKKAKLVIA